MIRMLEAGGTKMRWFAGFLGLVVLAAYGSFGTGAPLKGRVLALNETVPAGGSNHYVNTFKAGERASVTVSGNGATYLGLYVFDRFGNCVATDVGTTCNTMDDVAVEWYPSRVGRYTIEVKNLGQVPNTY